MPNYNAYMNKKEDEILMAYGSILASKGFIKNKVTRYGIAKFILTQAIDGFKEQLGKGIK